MAAGQRATRKKRINREDIPMTIRLKAWWEGYDPQALYALIASTEKPSVKKPGAPRAAAVTHLPENNFRWSDARIAANQMVWGAGHVEPPVPLEIKNLTRKMDMKAGHALLSIGAGLGGLNRLLSETLNYQIDGYDLRADIASRGNALATEKSPPLQLLESTKEISLPRRYDRLMITQTLGRHESVPTLISALSRHLKPGAKFVIYDWFRSAGTSRHQMQTALKHMSDPHFLAMTDASEFSRVLAAQNFNIAENILMTSDAIESLTKPWRQVVDTITAILHDMDRRDLVDELVAEAELWTARASLAQSGLIEARLFSGVFTGRADR